MTINTEQDMQDFVDMFYEAKISLYDDGEVVWLTVNQYEYIRDFMSFFTDDELLENKINGYFIAGEINFKWNEIMPLLDVDEEELYQKIRNCN